MKTIGRILACVLLAAVFAKNLLAQSAGNIEFSKGRGYESQARANVTIRLGLISRPADPDVGDSQSVPDDTSKTEDDKSDRGLAEPRTFGMKRVQFMLMPMMYKMGVMMTMLMVLTAVSVKGLFVGIILLVLKLSSFLAKFHSWHHTAPQEWSPTQPIHVHVHNSFPYAHTHGWEPSGAGMEQQHYYYRG